VVQISGSTIVLPFFTALVTASEKLLNSIPDFWYAYCCLPIGASAGVPGLHTFPVLPSW
jgi:hypothetical protein